MTKQTDTDARIENLEHDVSSLNRMVNTDTLTTELRKQEERDMLWKGINNFLTAVVVAVLVVTIARRYGAARERLAFQREIESDATPAKATS